MSNFPNLILFLSDDHAAWACGCYGNEEVHTPNLDYLANNGVQMLNAFTPTPVCSPARACLMTGRTSSQHGVHDYIGTTANFDVDFNWMQDEVLLPQLFQRSGYETALIGKWHLGQERIAKQGFDYSFTLGPDYPILHQGKRTWYRNGEPEVRQGLLSAIITEEAQSFLRNRTQDKPLFLVIGHYATHSPWSGHPDRLVEPYLSKIPSSFQTEPQYPFGVLVNEATDATRENPRLARSQYYAGVTEIDTSVGAILQEAADRQLDRNTVVIYTADHGLNCGQHGLWGKGNASYPLNMVEESIRVPLIFHAPSLLLSKQKRTEMVDHTDVFRTICELFCLEDPIAERRNSPGLSFLASLTNTRSKFHPKTLQFGEYGPVRMARSEQYKLVIHPQEENNLFFDLKQDPQERTNLYHDHRHEKMITTMRCQIDAYFARFSEEKHAGTRTDLPHFNPHVAWDYDKEYSL